MERNWEEFGDGPKDSKNCLHVTLGRKGVLMIGAVAFRALREPDAVVLLFDRETRVMGVRAAHIRAENAFPTKVKRRGSHRLVRAVRFCRHHGISVDRTARFRNAVFENGVLVLDTNSMVNV